MLFLTLGPNSLPVVVAQPDERHTNRTASVLEWYDRHRAYYNIWFKRSSNRTHHTRVKRTHFIYVYVYEKKSAASDYKTFIIKQKHIKS